MPVPMTDRLPMTDGVPSMHRQSISKQLEDALRDAAAHDYDGVCPECKAPRHRPCRTEKGDIRRKHDSRVAPGVAVA